MTDKDLTQSRRKLLLVAATAFVPMMIAYGLFFFAPDMIPKTTTKSRRAGSTEHRCF